MKMTKDEDRDRCLTSLGLFGTCTKRGHHLWGRPVVAEGGSRMEKLTLVRLSITELQCAKLVRSLAASSLLASSMARDGLLMYITSFGRFKSDLSITRIYRL